MDTSGIAEQCRDDDRPHRLGPRRRRPPGERDRHHRTITLAATDARSVWPESAYRIGAGATVGYTKPFVVPAGYGDIRRGRPRGQRLTARRVLTTHDPAGPGSNNNAAGRMSVCRPPRGDFGRDRGTDVTRQARIAGPRCGG